jgi:hypothetical protein
MLILGGMLLLVLEGIGVRGSTASFQARSNDWPWPPGAPGLLVALAVSLAIAWIGVLVVGIVRDSLPLIVVSAVLCATWIPWRTWRLLRTRRATSDAP